MAQIAIPKSQPMAKMLSWVIPAKNMLMMDATDDITLMVSTVLIKQPRQTFRCFYAKHG